MLTSKQDALQQKCVPIATDHKPNDVPMSYGTIKKEYRIHKMSFLLILLVVRFAQIEIEACL